MKDRPTSKSGDERDIPGNAVSLNRKDMFGLAEALRCDAEQFRERADKINAVIGSGNTGHREDRAWGADRRNGPAQPIVEFHDELADRAHRLLESVSTALSNLSGITDAVVTRFDDQDVLISATVDEVKAVTGLNQSSH